MAKATKGEHIHILLETANTLSGIEKSLVTANRLAIVKELYTHGRYTEKEYTEMLFRLIGEA